MLGLRKGNYKRAIIDVFCEQVNKNPLSIAVSHECVQLTYKVLNEQSNQIARFFLGQGIVPGNIISLLIEPSAHFIVILLAILKAEAVYLPLDSALPEKKLAQILEETSPKITVIDNGRPPLDCTQCISISSLYQSSMSYSKENLNRPFDLKNPVCIIYTSGSTGKPKGVMLSHAALVNLTSIENTLKINNKSIFAQFSNPMFDGAAFEIWTTLLNGANLVIIPRRIKKNFRKFKEFIEKNCIDYLFLPTSYFHLIAKSNPQTLDNLKGLMFGGEQINVHLLKKFLSYREKHKLSIKLINGYGPTETTAYTTCHRLDIDSTLEEDFLSSIGVNIQNSKIYILDENGNLASEGELCISGINLAIGYYGDQELTNKKFINNPFAQDELYKRLYKTGDRVKQLKNGSLLFLGRLDDQVKVRGFRVHLSEIEQQLMVHPDIIHATVLTDKEGKSESHSKLAAYLVTSNPSLEAKSIRNFLDNQLPLYMIPAKYFAIEDIPLTNIGKIDKQKIASVSKTNLDFKQP